MKGEPFEKIFGNTVELRLLEFLMSVPRDDFTISELERVTGVSRTSVDKVVKKFIEWGISKEVSRRGNMTMYALNEDSPIVKAAYALNGAIMERMYPELFDGPDAPLASSAYSMDEKTVDALSLPSDKGLIQTPPSRALH